MEARDGKGQSQTTAFVLPSIVVAAHELKVPLVLLRQLVLQASSYCDTTTDLRTKRIHERMQLTAERSLRLVEGITKAANLQDSLLDSEPIELHSLLQTVAHELSPLAQQLGHTFAVQTPRRAICLIGHREFLTSIMLSLCDNALTYSHPGTPIILAGNVKHDLVRLSVRDHGSRMSRVRVTDTSSAGARLQRPSAHSRSSGLGLWIADSFARTMQSQLELTRHHKGGVTFSVSLPRSQQLSLI